MRLNIVTRRLIGEAIQRGVKITWVAKVFGISRTTAYVWKKRNKRLSDRKRRPKQGKITEKVKRSILLLRRIFQWGSARIQQGICSLPAFMRNVIPGLVQGMQLSRTAINEVLRAYGLNGYKRKQQVWKFFRAKRPNELWQLDLKGPVHFRGRKYWFLVCIDDYSRAILVLRYFLHCPTTEQLFHILKPFIKRHKPKNVLTDNGNQFKEQWKVLCQQEGVKALFAHPYYPQDKGKVERAIRTVAEEFIYLLRKFPHWLGQMAVFQRWYNTKRYHRGIQTTPWALFS